MADINKINELKEQAYQMRQIIVRLARRVDIHIGGDLSMADMMTAIYMYKMRKDPKNVKWSGRDRFLLSKGHGAGCLYASMAMAGYDDLDEIYETYGKYGSRYGAHPCKVQNPALEMSSGSLGHGLALGTGLALAGKLKKEKHYVFVMLGDAECAEGSVWEAALSASNFKLGNLVAFVDRNRMSLSAPTEDSPNGMKMEPFADKWKAFGWNVKVIDGHNMEEIVDTLDNLPSEDSDVPTVIIGNTIKGKGIDFLENRVTSHNGMFDEEQMNAALESLKRNR
ncbi:MAG: transketolase [Acutalibacteraceae bacterium]|nr:transketolase [Acutalibacteraceae bacterium]